MIDYTYPLASTVFLEIFIFLVDPVYNSSKEQGSLDSTGSGFFSTFPRPVLYDRKLLSFALNPPKGVVPPSEGNLLDLFAPDDPNPKGLLPKNSAKISSAFLGLNPLFDGSSGGLSFNPSSPY